MSRNAESGAHFFLINVIFVNEAQATKKEDDEDGGIMESCQLWVLGRAHGSLGQAS